MRAVITVIGKDRTGIIAKVSGLLYDNNVNILDISQTILSDLFTMVMLVDLKGAGVSFDALHKLLTIQGEEMGVEARIQRTEIFDAMNKI